MKTSLFSLILLPIVLSSATAFAHPGSHTLTCSSANNKAEQKTTFTLNRSNGTGWFSPSIEVTSQGKTFKLQPEDEAQTYGDTVHDSPLGIIYVTAGTLEAASRSHFSIKAIPQSVKAFDSAGKPVKWNLQSENDDCNDSNGKAKFKGVFTGFIEANKNGTEPGTSLKVDAEIMDCELEYNSGMAC